MSSRLLIFDRNSAPTLAGGARLGAVGVNAPPLQLLGDPAGTSALDGKFSDVNGFGQVASDAAGRLFVGDYNNNRVQAFAQDAAGLWVYNSKCLATSCLGGAFPISLVAVDRVRNEIHLGSDSQAATGNWIGVWSLALWPNLTVANRTRSYGTNAFSAPGSGKALIGLTLCIDSTFAVVTSANSDFRVLRWNHLTGALDTEEAQAARYNRFVTDGAGNWWSGAPASGAAEPGLWKIGFTAPGTILGISRLDVSGYSGQNHRAGRPRLGVEFVDFGFYGGRVFAREAAQGRLMAWVASSGAIIRDAFLTPDAMGALASELWGGGPGHYNGAGAAATAKFGFYLAPSADYCDQLVMWASNAANDAAQSFLATFPLGVASATWSHSAFLAGGPTTLKAFLPFGKYLAAEKVAVQYRKTPSGGAAGAWKTVPWHKLADAAYIASLGDHTFAQGDLAEFRELYSIADRQDGDAQLTFCRDKLPVQEAGLAVGIDEPGDIYIAQPTGAIEGYLGAGGAIEGSVA